MIDHIFENPEAFAHEYRATLEALVGKDFRDCSAQDQYQALANLIARKANREFATWGPCSTTTCSTTAFATP